MNQRLAPLPQVLKGKVALVTGGARGLGAAIVRSLARHGAKVVFTYKKNEEAASALEAELRSSGAKATRHAVSVLDTAATAAMIRAVEADPDFGPIDVLVNNAGVSQNLPLPLLEEEDFDHVMDTNVKGTFLTSKAVLRSMLRRKAGVIVNIGSLAGARILEAPIHYATSKAAIVGMTRAMAKEVSRHGIRILCVSPGLLEDGLGKNLPEHKLKDYLHHCALGRVGTLAEVAELVSFLASDESTYTFGDTVVVDGGV